MASLRQILAATVIDIRHRITGTPGLPTTGGYGGGARNWFGPPGSTGTPGGDPYGPPVQRPPGPGGPHFSPPPNRVPDTGQIDTSQDFILAAHQNATNTLLHGRGYQVGSLDHHMTQAAATDVGSITHVPPPTTAPTHPPAGAPHWLPPAWRAPPTGSGPPGPVHHPPGL